MPLSALILLPPYWHPHTATHSPNLGCEFLFMHYIWPVAVALRRILFGTS